MDGAQTPVFVRLAEAAAGQDPANRGLAVVTVYQDAVAQASGSRFWEKIQRCLGPLTLREVVWSIPALEPDSAMRDAVMAAACADVIVIAVRAAEKLPVNLCRWMDAWLPKRRGREGVMVALIEVSGPTAAGLEQARQYLRTIARLGRLDFVCEECPCAGSWAPLASSAGVRPSRAQQRRPSRGI